MTCPLSAEGGGPAAGAATVAPDERAADEGDAAPVDIWAGEVGGRLRCLHYVRRRRPHYLPLPSPATRRCFGFFRHPH